MTKTGTDATPLPADETETFGEWMQEHSRQVGIAAIVVFAVALGVWLWRGASEKKAVDASRALAEGQVAFGSGNTQLAQSDLQKVVARYGGTTAGKQARLLLAQTYFDQKKYPEGLKLLDEGGNPEPFAASYHAVRAAGLEQSGKPADAAGEYLKASQTSSVDADKARYKADAARAYELAKNPAEATKLWLELAADENSPLSGEAKLRLGELAAKPASKG